LITGFGLFVFLNIYPIVKIDFGKCAIHSPQSLAYLVMLHQLKLGFDSATAVQIASPRSRV
jgi:hypothetical protein